MFALNRMKLTQIDPLKQFPSEADASIPSQNRERHRLRRLAVRRPEAARLMGVSVSTWRRWERSEAIPASLTVGSVALWSMRTLRLWMRWDCPSRTEFERRLQTAEANEVGLIVAAG